LVLVPKERERLRPCPVINSKTIIKNSFGICTKGGGEGSALDPF